MTTVPKLTAADYGYLRSLTEEIRLDVMKKHHLCDFTHGLDCITPKGRAALAAYDAEQRRAICVEAMRECFKAVYVLDVDSRQAIEDLIAKEESNG